MSSVHSLTALVARRWATIPSRIPITPASGPITSNATTGVTRRTVLLPHSNHGDRHDISKRSIEGAFHDREAFCPQNGGKTLRDHALAEVTFVITKGIWYHSAHYPS